MQSAAFFFGAWPDGAALSGPVATVNLTRGLQNLGRVSENVMQQTIVTLDLEGVLVPEIWIAFSEKTGIPELRRTTRDEPDYDVLMRGRLRILDEHGLKLADIQEVIGKLSPLDGAGDFLDQLRARTQVVILSDTFAEFAQPLMRQLGWPTLFCHQLEVDAAGRIVNYKLRQPNQKQRAVAALKSLSYKIIAAGDSFNDTTMLAEADVGFFFHAPKEYDAEMVKKHWNAEVPVWLKGLESAWKAVEDWSPANLEVVFKEFMTSQGQKPGKLMAGLRVALTGVPFGPGVFDIAGMIGKEDSLQRIERAITEIVLV